LRKVYNYVRVVEAHLMEVTYQFDRERSLIICWKMFFQCQNKAVGYDGEQHHVLKWRRLDGEGELTINSSSIPQLLFTV